LRRGTRFRTQQKTSLDNKRNDSLYLAIKKKQQEDEIAQDRESLLEKRPDLAAIADELCAIADSCPSFDWNPAKHLPSVKIDHVLSGKCNHCHEKWKK